MTLTPTILFRNQKNSSFETHNDFYPEVNQLRSEFDERFGNPYQATSNRFCWDYWSIPDKYRLLRTPAEQLFSKKNFTPFMNHLLNWGRRNLGCQMISHPWLSAYTDGCYQNLHSDVPHGPFSFVYSLTRWKKRSFRGGETLISQPRLLRYFSEITTEASHEEKDLLTRIPPEFNRLTVFDPRYPHGVKTVQGVDSILDSRLVIHGWFTEPRPMLEGTLSFRQILKPMDAYASSMIQALSTLPYFGLLSLRLEINSRGEVRKIEVLSAHLLDEMGATLSKAKLRSAVMHPPLFPKSSGNTWLTLPIEIRKT
jgi:hypothetical protein